MKQLLKSKQKLLISVTYIALVIVMCITILLIVLRIQSQYAGALINLRFNFYEGITFIGSPDNVWQYLIYAFLFSILNGLAILYIQKKFTKPEVQATIVYWIFGSSILSIGLLVIYLWLILSINS
ncbi:MAG: hypothetical protein RJB24_197 [Candidatus Parcubacteria bacterium]|jgi:hypothetical protein